MKNIFFRTVLAALMIAFGHSEANAQTQFLQKVLLVSGDSVSINFSEVRYASINGSGAKLAYGKPTVSYFTSSSLASIVSASCGNLVSLTEYNSSGGTVTVAVNPKWVKSASDAGAARTLLFMDGSPDRRVVSGSFSYISGLLGACVSGGGGGGGGGADSTIYNSNGSLTANRTLTGAGFSLTETGMLNKTESSSNLNLTTTTGGGATIAEISSGSISMEAVNSVSTNAASNTFTSTNGNITLSTPSAHAVVLPNSDTPTVNANGEISIDNTVTNYSHGLIKYYSGEEVSVIGVPTANLPSVNGRLLAYNSTNDEFEFVAPAAVGVDTAYNGLTVTSGDIKLGGSLTENTTINTAVDGRHVTVSGINSSGTLGNLRVENTNAGGSGVALSVTTPTSTGGYGIYVDALTGAADATGIYVTASGNAFEGRSPGGYEAAKMSGIGNESTGLLASTTGATRTSYGVRAIANSGGTGLFADASSVATGVAIEAKGRSASTATTATVLTINNTLLAQAAGAGVGIDFYQRSSTTADRITGQVATIWTTATDASRTSALQFSGVNNAGSLSEVARFSSATAPTMSIASAMGTPGTTTYSNGNITAGASFTVGNSSQSVIVGGNSGQVTLSTSLDNSAAISLTVSSATAASTGGITVGAGTFLQTSGTRNMMNFPTSFSPSSGSAVHNQLSFSGTINQTGGASGISRAIYVNPTLTSAADYRALETANGKVLHTDTYSAGSGALAGTLLDLAQTWNTSGSPTAIKLNVTNSASGASANLMDLQTGGTSRFKVDKSGNITANNVSSGTYTPTVTNSTNTDAAVTCTDAQWSRTGNVVTVSFRFTADPTTATGATSFEFSLPITSALAAAEDLAGTAFCGSVAGMGAAVNALAANDTGRVGWIASDVTSQSWSLICQYEIL